MANSIIEQSPLYEFLPVGQDIIYVVSNATAVSTETKVKFGVDVHISYASINMNTSNDLIGTFKTTPNNAGVGMFDLRSIIENYVKADNMAYGGSEYKGTLTTPNVKHPLHIIDKFSQNHSVVRNMQLRFFVEYLGATDAAGDQDDNVVRRAVGTSIDSDPYVVFNGYLNYTDVLTIQNANFGYDLTDFKIGNSTRKFLTNAPNTLYANGDDYGTLSFIVENSLTYILLSNITFDYYDSTDSLLSTETVIANAANGAYALWGASSIKQILHVGCYPGNRQNTSATFRGYITAGSVAYYDVYLKSASFDMTEKKRIYVNCPNQKGYESIRLTWLNQWGVWDYYTFTQKSIRSTSTQGSTYNQLEGTWNEGKYRIDSFKGGKKAFRVNATERITMNTEFVTEADTVVFEELINSPEVYMLKGYEKIVETTSALNQYVTPVRLLTSSFTKKTIANDKLMQYTFEVEKSKTLRTQSV